MTRVRSNRVRPAVELVSKKQVANMLGVHEATLDRWRREGRFPIGLVLSPQCVRWRLPDVEAWLRKRERDGGGTDG